MRGNIESSIQWRTVLMILALDLIMLTFIYWNIISVQGNIIKRAEASYMREQIHTMEAILLEIGQEYQILNQDIARDPEIKQAFEKSNFQGTSDISLPAYLKWQNKYSLNNMQLISPQGIVLWSINKSTVEEKDVSYRRLTQKSLQAKESQAALEFVDPGINLVSTVPLFSGNEFIGVSELSTSIDKALERKLVKKVSGKYSVFKLDGIHTSLIWQDKKSQVVLNTDDLKKIHQGEAFYRPSQDSKIMLLVVPLKDIDGIPIAYIQGEISRQTFAEARTNNQLFLLIITLLVLIVSAIIAGREGIGFSQAKQETVNLVDSCKISRVSINFKPSNTDISED